MEETPPIKKPVHVAKPSSGTKPQKRTKIYASHCAVKTNPNLGYIDLELSSIDNKDDELRRMPIRALNDCGCAKSIIKTSCFNELLKHGHIELKAPVTRLSLVSAVGAEQPITGLADIMLHFTGDNGINKSYELNVIVHPELSQDFLLGRDFTGSDARVIEIQEYMFLTDDFSTYVHSLKQALARKDLCKVPIIRKNMAPIKVAANKFTVIPALSTFYVECALRKSPTQEYQLPIHTVGVQTYEVVRSSVPHLKTMNMVLQYDQPNSLMIPFYLSLIHISEPTRPY